MRARLTANPVVFGISVLIILAFLVAGVAATETMQQVFTVLQSGIAASLDWYYVLVIGAFLVFVIWLGASRFGRMRLGPQDSEPEYRYLTWFAMLFTAGMGIGIVFWAVAEPLSHLAEPPTEDAGTAAAETEAMRFTFFHWGVHAWAIYIVVGLSLAYFAYRHKLPLSIRSGLYPILGERIHGRWGDAVDTFAAVGTIFGVATSLGFGILQVNAGLSSLNLLPQSTAVQLTLIVILTFAAVCSLIAGLDKGFLRLSVTNLCIGVALMVFVLVAGPTRDVLGSFVQQLGHYVQTLPETTLWTESQQDNGWQAGWTIFYWGWWMSWSPFVGMFIARVSRGRTVREFVFGVMLVPALFSFLWMAIFGNTAFSVDAITGGEISAQVGEDPAIALFGLLGELPFTSVVTVLAILVITVYFVTSSDSASLVLDTLTSGGRTDAPTIQRVFWAILQGAIAAVLLLAGAGGLDALQTAAITTALPFSVIMLLMCYGLIRALYADDRVMGLDRIALSDPAHSKVPARKSAWGNPFRDRVQGAP